MKAGVRQRGDVAYAQFAAQTHESNGRRPSRRVVAVSLAYRPGEERAFPCVPPRRGPAFPFRSRLGGGSRIQAFFRSSGA
jgi:hypothetical protein